jgi:hypothetical protein
VVRRIPQSRCVTPIDQATDFRHPFRDVFQEHFRHFLQQPHVAANASQDGRRCQIILTVLCSKTVLLRTALQISCHENSHDGLRTRLADLSLAFGDKVLREATVLISTERFARLAYQPQRVKGTQNYSMREAAVMQAGKNALHMLVHAHFQRVKIVAMR